MCWATSGDEVAGDTDGKINIQIDIHTYTQTNLYSKFFYTNFFISFSLVMSLVLVSSFKVSLRWPQSDSGAGGFYL